MTTENPTAAERAAHRADPSAAYTSQIEREGMSEPLPVEITREEFCARFKARMLAVAGPFFAQEGPDAPESVAEYADQAAPTYWDDPDQREEGPEVCADTDISYWEG